MVARRLLLPVVLLMALLLIASVAGQEVYAVETDFAGGDGSEGDPFQIKTAEHLDNVRDYVKEPYYFVQIKDIDLKGMVWEPIPEFPGYYNGKGNTIHYLYINNPEEDYTGLFANTLEGSQIINVNLVQVNVTGKSRVGGLVGCAKGNIEHCKVSGQVNGDSQVGGLVGRAYTVPENPINILFCTSNVDVIGRSWVGGLVGIFSYGVISNCTASGNLTGILRDDSPPWHDYLGGLVGGAYDGEISDSSSSASVSGDTEADAVGGLVGQLGESCTIINCSATGPVSGHQRVGGLVGWNFGFIIDSYATSVVNGVGRNVGGLVGRSQNSISTSFATGSVTASENAGGLVGSLAGGNDVTIENSYATGSVNAVNSVGGLVGSKAAQSLIANTYAVGAVIGESDVGGLVGRAGDVDNVSASYYDSWTTLQSDDTGKGFPRTTTQMQEGYADSEINGDDIYTGWSTDIWEFKPSYRYPWLIDNPPPPQWYHAHTGTPTALAYHQKPIMIGDIVGAFPSGIWVHDGDSWSHFHTGTPSALAYHDGVVVGAFPSGIWKHDGGEGDEWYRFHTGTPSALAYHDGTVVGAFPSGIWVHDGDSWSRFHTGTPSALAYHDGTVVGAFPSGIWVHQ